MNKVMNIGLGFVVIMLLCGSQYSQAATISVRTFGAEAFNSDRNIMDSTLGIENYSIEDFEDLTMVQGLGLLFDGQSHTSGNNFTPQISGGAIDQAKLWDGTQGALNRSGGTSADRSRKVTFELSKGVVSFGVGFGNMQANYNPTVQLLVNGLVVVDRIAELSKYNNVISAELPQRNIYIRLDATDSFINTVSFNIADPNLIDDITFDHVAFKSVPVPAPATILLFGPGIAGLVISQLGRKKK